MQASLTLPSLTQVMKEKTLKPLNSYIAFRSYYSKIFQPFQQKEISGFLTFLWQGDPFHSKWSVLATSYTVLREHIGKHMAPLDKFLAINGPYIGIIHPDNYLYVLGFEIALDQASFTIRRSEDFNLDSLGPHLFSTNISVTDVIENTLAHGYCSGNSINLSQSSRMLISSASTSDVRNMSFTAQMSRFRTGNGFGNVSQKFAPMPLAAPSVGHPSSMTKHSDTAIFSSNTHQYLNGLQSHSPRESFASPTISLHGEEEQETPEANIALPSRTDSAFELANINFNLHGEFPFNESFAGEGKSLTFDPYTGSSFNCYDIGEYEM